MKKQEKKIGSGKVGQFDQRNTMFSRPRDPEWSNAEILELGKKHYFLDARGIEAKKGMNKKNAHNGR